MTSKKVTRRTVLGTLGIGASAYVAKDLFAPALASANDGAELPLMIFAYFEGGWDTLLSLDPRSDTDPNPRIDAFFSELADSDDIIDDILTQTSGSGIVKPGADSNIEFGPAVGELADCYQDLCVVRGIDMGTLTHEVGRRYFLTGKFPRGLQANGSALPTWVVNQTTDQSQLPNLVMGNETYNEGLGPAASGVVVQRPEDLAYLMQPLSELNPNEYDLPSQEVNDKIAAFHDQVRCQEQRLDSLGLVDTYRQSRASATHLSDGGLFEHFNFAAPAGQRSPALDAFIDSFMAGADYDATSGTERLSLQQAMIAAQAVRTLPGSELPVSQAVSITLAEALDDHDDSYLTDHSTKLRNGFNAAAKLIKFLKTQADGPGKTLWDRTVLVLWSEFARGPLVNGRSGRDHHLSSACVVAGGGIAGNKVIGETDDRYEGVPIDPDTGTRDPGGIPIRPADVHATVLQAMNLSYDHISNQQPQIIPAMLANDG